MMWNFVSIFLRNSKLDCFSNVNFCLGTLKESIFTRSSKHIYSIKYDQLFVKVTLYLARYFLHKA